MSTRERGDFPPRPLLPGHLKMESWGEIPPLLYFGRKGNPMMYSENPYRMPGLVALALLTGPLSVAICLLLAIVQLPVLGMCSYLVTVPLAAYLLGRCAGNFDHGGILG